MIHAFIGIILVTIDQSGQYETIKTFRSVTFNETGNRIICPIYIKNTFRILLQSKISIFIKLYYY